MRVTQSEARYTLFVACINSTPNANQSISRLPVAPEVESVVPLPGLPPASVGLVVPVALLETSALLAGSRKTTAFTVLVNGVDDPVDAGIAANSLVLGIDEDDLEVLVGAVLVDPVAVEDTQVGAATTHTLFGGGPKRTTRLELVHTLILGLAVGGTVDGSQSSYPTHKEVKLILGTGRLRLPRRTRTR